LPLTGRPKVTKGARYRAFEPFRTPNCAVWLFGVCQADADSSRATAQIP